MIVEDGTGLANADAYVTVDYCADYCTERGLTFGTSPTLVGEQAIVRATAALDAIYRGRFSGYKTHGRDQSLEWPRTASYDREFYTLPNDEIPTEVKYATCEMAVRELADPGSMMPDLERGGQVRRLKAGSVEIEYGSNSMAQTTFQLVDGIMSGLLGSQPLSFVGVAVRG
jgi:hypothetical protein